jgi:hypothetical protein
MWFGSRRYRRFLFLPLAVMALLVAAIVALATGPVGTASKFEDDDGNLVDNTPLFDSVAHTGDIDWNNFDPTTWTGTQPDRESAKSFEGWDFTGLEDAQAVTTDDSFAGGTKQNKDCATVGTGKADNKADLKRIYMATKTLANGHVILNLAWVRIPQNTTSPSAHVAFEFNQNSTLCSGSGHDGLVPRSSANGGDLLVLYDFEGGTDTPVISISRWTAAGDWSAPVALTSGQAEAKVNTDSTADDTIAPSDETLGIKEFGEAGIDLTNAGVFPATPTSCLTFGRGFGVTRTSGNSNTAQMKDLIGPADVSLTNCGTVIIRKVTDPAGDTTTSFGYTDDVVTLPATTTSPFSLKDGEHNTISNVKTGSYQVTEDAPGPAYALDDIDCSASDTATAPTEDEANRKASFTVGAGETVDCTFTNKKQEGALRILKNSAKTGTAVANDGAVFSYDDGVANPVPTVTDNGTGDEDTDVGEVCVSGLAPGDYTVNEDSPPDGYGAAPASEIDQTATVVAGTDCGDNQPSAAQATFTNPPLADIQVNFRDAGSGETALDQALDCDNATGTDDTTTATGWDDTLTVEDVEAGSSVVTITCTIKIDP